MRVGKDDPRLELGGLLPPERMVVFDASERGRMHFGELRRAPLDEQLRALGDREGWPLERVAAAVTWAIVQGLPEGRHERAAACLRRLARHAVETSKRPPGSASRAQPMEDGLLVLWAYLLAADEDRDGRGDAGSTRWWKEQRRRPGPG